MASLDRATCRTRLSASRVAHLATVTTAGLPHVVPCCFVLADDAIYSVVDGKPKSTMALKRLDNIRATPAASLVADHYDDDWRQLWWVRADGPATVVDPVGAAAERSTALALLADKYDQYRADTPEGPLLRIDVTDLTGWAFTPPSN